MPLHDHECTKCGYEHEEFIEWDIHSCLCPACGGMSVRVYIKFNGIKHDAPNWLKDTLEVVDKDGGKHCQDFLKHPNRRNYKGWMKGEGLRPLEEGEKLRRGPNKKEKAKRRTEHLHTLKTNFKKRNAITVGA